MCKRKENLNLINNYVEIYKCIFDCKQGFLKEKNNAKNIKDLTQLIDELMSIKKHYEEIFVNRK